MNVFLVVTITGLGSTMEHPKIFPWELDQWILETNPSNKTILPREQTAVPWKVVGLEDDRRSPFLSTWPLCMGHSEFVFGGVSWSENPPTKTSFLFNNPETEKCSYLMDVSKNRGGPPKSSILIGFSIINHPFWGVSLFLETPLCTKISLSTPPQKKTNLSNLHQAEVSQADLFEIIEIASILDDSNSQTKNLSFQNGQLGLAGRLYQPWFHAYFVRWLHLYLPPIFLPWFPPQTFPQTNQPPLQKRITTWNPISNHLRMDVWWFPTISYVKIGNHPIETTIYKWLAARGSRH